MAGLSPKFISVNVSGNIESVGAVNVPLEASMSDALDISGPQKILSGDIYLIKSNRDGTITEKKGLNILVMLIRICKRNPFLLEGFFFFFNLVTIRRSRFLYNVSETINQVARPLSKEVIFLKI